MFEIGHADYMLKEESGNEIYRTNFTRPKGREMPACFLHRRIRIN